MKEWMFHKLSARSQETYSATYRWFIGAGGCCLEVLWHQDRHDQFFSRIFINDNYIDIGVYNTLSLAQMHCKDYLRDKLTEQLKQLEDISESGEGFDYVNHS